MLKILILFEKKLHFLSIFFEKSRKFHAELFAKSKKSEKVEKNSKIFHAQNRLSANGQGGHFLMNFDDFDEFSNKSIHEALFFYNLSPTSHKSIHKDYFSRKFSYFQPKAFRRQFSWPKAFCIFKSAPPPSSRT